MKHLCFLFLHFITAPVAIKTLPVVIKTLPVVINARPVAIEIRLFVEIITLTLLYLRDLYLQDCLIIIVSRYPLFYRFLN